MLKIGIIVLCWCKWIWWWVIGWLVKCWNICWSSGYVVIRFGCMFWMYLCFFICRLCLMFCKFSLMKKIVVLCYNKFLLIWWMMLYLCCCLIIIIVLVFFWVLMVFGLFFVVGLNLVKSGFCCFCCEEVGWDYLYVLLYWFLLLIRIIMKCVVVVFSGG